MAEDAPMTPEELELAVFILGPWLIGCLVDVLLQGVLFGQFSRYYTTYTDDKLGPRLLVLGLFIITTLKSIHSFAATWTIYILHFKDLNGAIMLMYTEWWLTGSGLMVASIGLYVQAFFCHRLWVISKKNYLFVVPIVVVLIFAYVASCVATYYITLGYKANHEIATWFAAHLSSVFAGDFLITTSIAYFLLKSRREVLPQTVGLINALVRLTFLTSAPAAMCAMLNLVFSQIYTGDNKLISAAFNQGLAKLYAFSMMWTLNARRSLRADMNKDPSTELSNRRPSARNGSQSTTVDVRRMFHLSSDEAKSSNTHDFKMTV